MANQLKPLIGEPQLPNFAPKLYGIAALVAAIILIGLLLVARFTALDLARDINAWQEKLNLIAESRTADVNHYITEHFQELRTLADNPSLQLYMSELQSLKAPKDDKPDDNEPAPKTYLRNLVLFTAERAGLTTRNALSSIPANVQPESKSGLAIVNNNNQILVSTLMQAGTKSMILDNAKKATAGQEALIDIRKDKEDDAFMGFVVPIFSIQGDHNADSQMGRVVGIKAVGDGLFGLLKHPGTTEQTLETMLVRQYDNKIEYLSPLQDGTNALGRQEEATSTLAEAKLLATPGSFTSDLRDYRDKMVLATSRPIAGTPWTLIVKIDRKEALAVSEQHRASMEVFFLMIIAIIVLIIIAIWWHASSRRSMMMSGYFRTLAAKATAQEQLLRLVADNQPEPIYIVDGKHTFHFANLKAASENGMSFDSVAGKSLADVRGAARADHIAEQCDKVLRNHHTSFDVTRTTHDGVEKVVRSAYVPLDHIPIMKLPDPTPGVLVVEQDISEVVHEREQRLNTHRQLVEMLIKLVDARDPFAANHSLLVSQIANEIAVDMELDNITVETTRTAGSLMNIGKIVVPTELLTKTDSMTTEEKRVIRDSMNAAADLLKEISFDGPVSETLRQWQERWDGSGPLGLKGEAILISARIIAAANAFIGMISPRSWRTAIPIESATKFLLDQSGHHFDRRVVIALINYVENHSGRAWLKKVLDEQKHVA